MRRKRFMLLFQIKILLLSNFLSQLHQQLSCCTALEVKGVLKMTKDSSPEWDETIVAEYESRVEPFTGSFIEEMIQPFCSEEEDTNEKRRKITNGEEYQDGVDKQLAGPSLLDVGCGTGVGSIYASQHHANFQVTATDVSSFMVERTKRRSISLKQDIECVVSDGQTLPSTWTNRFDYAMGSFSVIFFKNVPKGLEEICRCLKDNGKSKVAISCWGKADETPAFQVFPDAIKEVAPELLEGSKPKRITGIPPVLKSIMEQAGFVDVQVVGPIKRNITVASSEAFHDRFALGSPNTKGTITKMSSEQRHLLKKKVMELAEERGGGKPDGTIKIPSSAYFAYGTKPTSSQSS